LLLVSWLLVALFPALLMLAALGLSRLEDRLVDGMLIADDGAEILAQATGELTHRPSRVEHSVDPRQIFTADPQGLPTGRHRHSRANRQYGQTGQRRHADRV
jgi:hypothetical protein